LLTAVLQGADGSRQPTELELSIAEAQGKAFYETVSKVTFA
jgi:NAD(P)H dehydrogenase (quinone)